MDFFLGISNKCNLNCEWCAHYRLREMDMDYFMSEEEFSEWYTITDKAGYYFDCININGLGEPLEYPDIRYLQYMLIKLHKFTNTVNILSNGLNIDKMEKILPFVENVSISMWNTTKWFWSDIESFQELHENKIHLRYNIELHDLRLAESDVECNDIVRCGCCGPGYTMHTVFLVCGTWAPKIDKNGLYHSNLKDNYLKQLDKNIGYTAYPMCSKCWANTNQMNLYKDKKP